MSRIFTRVIFARGWQRTADRARLVSCDGGYDARRVMLRGRLLSWLRMFKVCWWRLIDDVLDASQGQDLEVQFGVDVDDEDD
jgi:hypothetical protein